MSGAIKSIAVAGLMVFAVVGAVNMAFKDKHPNPAYEGRPYFEIYDRAKVWLGVSEPATQTPKNAVQTDETDKPAKAAAKPKPKRQSQDDSEPVAKATAKPKPKPKAQRADSEWDSINADLDTRLAGQH